ncbi:MAG: hypothetical protein R3323_06935 [Wenzhouxiangellaceae bacterium]|nr:hypothetical protein [Wenzhouxiangellaceae bacterium]
MYESECPGRPGAALLLAAAVSAGCASPQVHDPSSELDPVKAAPDIYTNELENEHVRTIGVTIRPGAITPVHSHPGRVVVFLTPCVLRPVSDDGIERVIRYEVGDVEWAPAEVHGGYSYPVTEECRVVEVEVKDVVR